MTAKTEEIRRYWNDQGRKFKTDPRATTPDFWMREVEIDAISQLLPDSDARVLDIGCGNGYSTCRILERHPSLNVTGGDFAPEMVEAAEENRGQLPASLQARLKFDVVDVLDLSRWRGDFDFVVSDRVLINLPDIASQRMALGQIATALRPGGTYIAIENFVEPYRRFNTIRLRHGLPTIDVRWHNLYLDEATFVADAAQYFELRGTIPISSTYYLVTRIVYSKLCQIEGREPDYDHPIYGIAAKLPYAGDFGPIKLLEFRRRD